MRPARRLIVNADDLGLAASVNRGILEGIEHGVITSASLLVNLPAFRDAIDRLRDALGRGATPSIGLHLNLVAGRPLAMPRTLMTRTGEFLPLPVLAWQAWRGRLDPREVEAEIEAQLLRAAQALAPLGLRITHVDSHRHAHCLPGVYDAVLSVARRVGVLHVRHPAEQQGTQLGRPRAVLAASLLRVATGRLAPVDDVRFAGVALMASRSFEADLQRLIHRLPSGVTELMVHPGYDSAELAAMDPYRAPRERELRALTAPALRRRLQEAGVELTSFDATAVAVRRAMPAGLAAP